MSEPQTDVVQEQTAPEAPAEQQHPVPEATDKTDAVLAKLKELLKVAGHDVEAVFDDVVALAKKNGVSNTGCFH